MKRKWVLWSILATLVLAIVVHVATIMAVPYVMMNTQMSINTKSKSVNVVSKATRASAAIRTAAVRPNADMYMSNFVYDLSKGPVLFTAQVPVDHYWSVSYFANNSDNFFVINDTQVKSNPVKILLISDGMKYSNPDNALVVTSPSIRGIGVIRQAIPGADRLKELADLQNQATISLPNAP
jgi:uncharacterized membrane protein